MPVIRPADTNASLNQTLRIGSISTQGAGAGAIATARGASVLGRAFESISYDLQVRQNEMAVSTQRAKAQELRRVLIYGDGTAENQGAMHPTSNKQIVGLAGRTVSEFKKKAELMEAELDNPVQRGAFRQYVDNMASAMADGLSRYESDLLEKARVSSVTQAFDDDMKYIREQNWKAFLTPEKGPDGTPVRADQSGYLQQQAEQYVVSLYPHLKDDDVATKARELVAAHAYEAMKIGLMTQGPAGIVDAQRFLKQYGRDWSPDQYREAWAAIETQVVKTVYDFTTADTIQWRSQVTQDQLNSDPEVARLTQVIENLKEEQSYQKDQIGPANPFDHIDEQIAKAQTQLALAIEHAAVREPSALDARNRAKETFRQRYKELRGREAPQEFVEEAGRRAFEEVALIDATEADNRTLHNQAALDGLTQVLTDPKAQLSDAVNAFEYFQTTTTDSTTLKTGMQAYENWKDFGTIHPPYDLQNLADEIRNETPQSLRALGKNPVMLNSFRVRYSPVSFKWLEKKIAEATTGKNNGMSQAAHERGVINYLHQKSGQVYKKDHSNVLQYMPLLNMATDAWFENPSNTEPPNQQQINNMLRVIDTDLDDWGMVGAEGSVGAFLTNRLMDLGDNDEVLARTGKDASLVLTTAAALSSTPWAESSGFTADQIAEAMWDDPDFAARAIVLMLGDPALASFVRSRFDFAQDLNLNPKTEQPKADDGTTARTRAKRGR